MPQIDLRIAAGSRILLATRNDSEDGVAALSVWIITKADLDAYVSIAYRWTQAGEVATMPPEVAEVLTITDQNADEVGAWLWAANHDAFNFGGPKRLVDPALLAEDEQTGQVVEMPPYDFQAFEGMPSPAIALNRAGYYRYQTMSDYWEESSDWEAGREPFELKFTFGMEWWACKSLQIDPKVKLYRKPGRFLWTRDDGDVDYPAGLQAPDGRRVWRLNEEDRDLFAIELETI